MIDLVTVPLDLIDLETAPESKIQQISLKLTNGNIDPVKLGYNKSTGRYWIINGRRRITDSLAIGSTDILAIVDKEVDATEGHLQAILLNSGKPNQMDESDHIQNLLDSGKYNVKLISSVCNMQPQIIYSRLRLQLLIPEFKELLRKGDIKYSAAIIIIKLSVEQQEELLKSEIKLTHKNVAKFLAEKQADFIAPALDFDLPNTQQSFNELTTHEINEEQMKELIAGGIMIIGNVKIKLDREALLKWNRG